jgi:hypothetical protein
MPIAAAAPSPLASASAFAFVAWAAARFSQNSLPVTKITKNMQNTTSNKIFKKKLFWS